MRSTQSLLSLLLLAFMPLLAAAFTDTKPLLAYSTRSPFGGLEQASQGELRGPALYSRDVAKGLTKDARALCEGVDAIALVEVNELHSHTFSSLPSDNGVKQRAMNAASSFGLQHVSERTGSAASELASAIKRTCTGKRGVPLERFQSNIRMLQDGRLASVLADFEKQYPRHTVLLTGAAETPRYPSVKRATGSAGSSAKARDTSGLFHHYQFWSTGLLFSALVIGLLFFPVALVATSMIGSITTPDKLGEKSRLTDMSKKAT